MGMTRRDFMKGLLVGGVAAGSAGLLAACGSSSSSTDTSSSSADTSASTSSAETTTTTEAASDVEVVLNCSSNLTNVTWDMMNTHQSYGSAMLYGYLMEMDAEGNLSECEATDWELAEDGMSATVTIRDDIYFSSGNQMTSADVQYTLMRPVNDRTLAQARTFNSLEDVEIVDDYTVKLIMNSPWPTCIEDIYGLAVLDSAEVESLGETEYFNFPTAAGPFKLVSFDPVNSQFELERYDGWWGWDVIDNPTNVDKVTYVISSEDTTRVSALRTGEFDLIELVPFDDVATLESEGFTVQETVENRHVMLGFNYEGIFGNQDLREAVSLAIDRELIVDSIIGVGWPATWSWSQGVSSNPDSEGYEYNMERAQELVAANYDGSEVNLLTSSGTTTRVNELCQALQSMLMEAGFTVKINMVEEATYDTLRPAGEYDIAIGVFNCTATGEAYKEVCEIIGGDIFSTNHNDEELLALVAEVEGNCNDDARHEAEREVYQYEMDNFGPYVYLYCTTGIKAANSKLDMDSMGVDASGTWSIMHVQVAE